MQSTSKFIKRPLLGVERAQKRCHKRGCHVYMKIWKPLVGKCLQYVKEPTNEVDKNGVASFLTNSHFKRWLTTCNKNFHHYVRVSLYSSLPHYVLDIFATGRRINHGGEYRLEIPANFHFCGPEKAVKQTKKKKTSIEKNLNKTVEHCIKENVYKFITKNVLCSLLLSMSAVEKSVR